MGAQTLDMGPRLPDEAREALILLLDREGVSLRATAVDWVIRESVDLQGRRPRAETEDLVERSFEAWRAYLLHDDYGPLEGFIQRVVSYRGAQDFHVSTPQRGLLSFKKAVRPHLQHKTPSLRLILVEALDEAYERVLFQLSDAFQEEVIRQHAALTERAESHRAAQTAFLANIGHEVRTPLSSLLGFAELIERTSGMVAPEELAAYMLNLKDNAHQLLDLVDDVVDLSRLEGGLVVAHPEDLDLWRLLTDVHQDLKGEADRRGVLYPLTIAPGLTRYARVDPGKLARALTCLLRAALRLSPPGCAVRTRVSLPRPGWLCAHIDEAGPVSLQDRLHWFEGLLQAPDHRGSGPGLAVAVARGLSQLMGGELTLQGEPGAFQWTLALPIADLEEVGSTSEVAVAPSRGLRHVLVVGDEQTPQSVLREFFTTAGITSSFCQDDTLAGRPYPDVVLADSSGHAPALGALAEHPELKHVPVVVATPEASSLRVDLKRAGVYEVIDKPLDLDELMTALLDAAATPGLG